MKSYTLGDGTVIEIQASDTYSGPAGKPGCQRTSMTVPWYRLNGGEWEHSPWRTLHKIFDAVECCENKQDFFDLINYEETR